MLNVFTGSVFFSWDSVLKMHCGHYKTQDIFTSKCRMLKEVFWKVLSQCMEGGDPEGLKHLSTQTQNVNVNVNVGFLLDSAYGHYKIPTPFTDMSNVEGSLLWKQNVNSSFVLEKISQCHCIAGTRRGRGLQWTPKVGFTPETLASGN